MRIPEGKCYLTTYVDRETMEELDKLRGEIPRNRIVRRAINQFLERETAVIKNLQGPRISSQAQAAPTPTSTSTDLAHRRADELIGKTTDDVATSGEEDCRLQ